MQPSLATRVSRVVRERVLLRPGTRVCVAVSGGADSVALLRLLGELRADLGLVLSVAHFNHRIRPEADEDERFVAALAAQWNAEFYRGEADIPALARKRKQSLETTGREARYEFFHGLLASRKTDVIATAHTLDDQAETVLMRIVRGSGTAGLAGIQRRLALGDGVVVRPLLDIRHAELEEYLHSIAQRWREDSTNADVKHTRNRVRHVLLPLLEREFNPCVREALADFAEIANAEEEHWRTRLESARGDIESGRRSLADIAVEDLALARRVIRSAAEGENLQLNFPEVERTLEMVRKGVPGRVELHEGWEAVLVDPASLRFRRELSSGATDYEQSFEAPGELRVYGCGVTLRFQSSEPRIVTVRNWRDGDRFFARGTSGPKKVKELLSRKHVTGDMRKSWPVVAVDGRLIWLRGFGMAADYDGVLVEESSTEESSF